MDDHHAQILKKLADEASSLLQQQFKADPLCSVTGYFQGRLIGLRQPELVPHLNFWLASEHHSRAAAGEANPWTQQYLRGLAEALSEAAFILACR
jgi:hypothetical protein